MLPTGSKTTIYVIRYLRSTATPETSDTKFIIQQKLILSRHIRYLDNDWILWCEIIASVSVPHLITTVIDIIFILWTLVILEKNPHHVDIS